MVINSKYIVGICGASGAVYAVALLSQMLKHLPDIHAVVSVDGRGVMAQELDFAGDLAALIETQHPDAATHPDTRLMVHDVNNFFVPPASGSFKLNGIVMVARIMGHLGLDYQFIGEWGNEKIV